MSCPIPYSVLKRRRGVPIEWRLSYGYSTYGYPNGGSSSMALRMTRYKVGRKTETYWVHSYRECDNKGRVINDIWETFTPKSLPRRLRGLNDCKWGWEKISP